MQKTKPTTKAKKQKQTHKNKKFIEKVSNSLANTRRNKTLSGRDELSDVGMKISRYFQQNNSLPT